MYTYTPTRCILRYHRFTWLCRIRKQTSARDGCWYHCAQVTKAHTAIHPGFETHGQQSHPKSKTEGNSGPTNYTLVQRKLLMLYTGGSRMWIYFQKWEPLKNHHFSVANHFDFFRVAQCHTNPKYLWNSLGMVQCHILDPSLTKELIW